jgi:hypothetical protein
VPPPAESLLSGWHDFFVLIGTAAATLIGAMFVVVSIGIGFLTRERVVATHTFLTSTVTHLSVVLFGSVLVMVPRLDLVWLGALLGLAGLGGLGYSVRVVAGFGQHQGTDRSDWFWYAVFPFVGYGLLLAAGAAALRGAAPGLDLLAASLASLLLASIRNAWDMIVFLVTRPRDST